ncbi:hypothetical protein M9Y10_042208 [Tritrichomonas musculus]|uniref:Uncharacterized protein n=1 Tax=Tritrichomonas musculus TaxID=1915356 RepID=A0ABR2K6I1_9EUKA
MNKNVIFKRKNSICKLIEDFVYENEVQIRNIQDDESINNISLLLQNALGNEKKNYLDYILKEIEHQKEEIIQKRDYISMFRKEKANILNELIIKNRLLKRNIQTNIKKKNMSKKIIQIDDNPNNSISFENYHLLSNNQTKIIRANHIVLLQVYGQAKKIKKNNLFFLHNAIDELKLEIKRSFRHLQEEIDKYQRYFFTNQNKEYMEHVKASQQYYLVEISKLKAFNNEIVRSFDSLCNEFNISPIEYANKELKNKSTSVRRDVIYKELSKIYHIHKRIDIKSSAKIIIDYIIKNLKEKDNLIISNLKEKENSCSIIKEKIQRIEIKQQLALSKNGTLHPTIWDQSQSDIAKNIHDIKLMQKSLFKY